MKEEAKYKGTEREMAISDKFKRRLNAAFTNMGIIPRSVFY